MALTVRVCCSSVRPMTFRGCGCGKWDGCVGWMGRDTLLGPEGSNSSRSGCRKVAWGLGGLVFLVGSPLLASCVSVVWGLVGLLFEI